MKSLALKIKLAVLRSRLARVSRAIEEVEHYQQHHAQNLERLLRAAGNLRADIWWLSGITCGNGHDGVQSNSG